MDLATLIGLLGGTGIILAAIVVDGSALVFINAPAALVVIGGTLGAVLMKFTLSQFLGAFKVATKAFMFKLDQPESLIQQGYRNGKRSAQG